MKTLMLLGKILALFLIVGCGQPSPVVQVRVKSNTIMNSFELEQINGVLMGTGDLKFKIENNYVIIQKIRRDQ